MIIPALLNSLVTVRRRTSTGRDALNNPVYGAPASGAGWNTVYIQMPVRFAFSSKGINFVMEGERLTPRGVMYYNNTFLLQAEDRIITDEGIQYVVIAISVGRTVGQVISHFEAALQLP